MQDIKKNIFYNLIYASSQFLFPLITFPYVSQILGPEAFGAVSFSDTYSKYFGIIAALGIPIYGIREVSKASASKETLNSVFYEIFIIHLISTFLIFLFYIASIISSDKLSSDLPLHLISAVNILALPFLFDWFFAGIEKFKVIMIRSLVSRAIPLLFLFIIVKTKEDYLNYQILNVSTYLINALLNLFIIKKRISLKVDKIKLTPHLKPLTIIFFSTVLTSLYTMMDVVMLGFLDTEKAVGLYAASIKINRLVVISITSLGTVLMSRISSLIKSNDIGSVADKIEKSLKFSSILAFPAMIGLALLANETIYIFSGIEFKEAVSAIWILSPVIIMLPFASVFGAQVLLPMEKDRQYLICVSIGSILNVGLNIVLIPLFSFRGAAISTLTTEFAVTIAVFIFARKALTFRFPWASIKRSFYFSLLFIPVIVTLRLLLNNQVVIFWTAIVACGILYFTLQLIFREPLMIVALDTINSFVRKRKSN